MKAYDALTIALLRYSTYPLEENLYASKKK